MNLAEAEKIALIAGTADDGCPCCVGNIVDRLNAAFPEFRWERTGEDAFQQYEGSDDPDDRERIGVVVTVQQSPPSSSTINAKSAGQAET